MSKYWPINCLIPSIQLPEAIFQLLNASNAELFYPVWNFTFNAGLSADEFKDILINLEQYQKPIHFSLGSHRQGLDTLSQQKIDFSLNPNHIFTYNHSFFLLELALPTSSGRSYLTSRKIWALLEKVLSILLPFFTFSGNFEATSPKEGENSQPWTSYWETMIFSKDLLSQVDQASLITLKSFSYYYKQVDSLLWISSPRGIGNEFPYRYGVVKDYPKEIYIEDEKLMQWIESENTKHKAFVQSWQKKMFDLPTMPKEI